MTDRELMQIAMDVLSNKILQEIKVVNALLDRLAHPEPEPVLWERREDGKVGPANAPPKREWVGLTDEEIQDIRLKTLDSVATNYEAYRAIESKLKEKNS